VFRCQLQAYENNAGAKSPQCQNQKKDSKEFAMRLSTARSDLRIFHILIGVAISAFIYSPALQSNTAFAAALQFGAVPVIGISGLIMWKPRLLRPLLK
jgi:hypothetical protein